MPNCRTSLYFVVRVCLANLPCGFVLRLGQRAATQPITGGRCCQQCDGSRPQKESAEGIERGALFAHGVADSNDVGASVGFQLFAQKTETLLPQFAILINRPVYIVKSDRRQRVLFEITRAINDVAGGVGDLQVVPGTFDGEVGCDLRLQLRHRRVFRGFQESLQIRGLGFQSGIGDREQVLAQDKPHALADNDLSEQEQRQIQQHQAQGDRKFVHR